MTAVRTIPYGVHYSPHASCRHEIPQPGESVDKEEPNKKRRRKIRITLQTYILQDKLKKKTRVKMGRTYDENRPDQTRSSS